MIHTHSSIQHHDEIVFSHAHDVSTWFIMDLQDTYKQNKMSFRYFSTFVTVFAPVLTLFSVKQFTSKISSDKQIEFQQHVEDLHTKITRWRVENQPAERIHLPAEKIDLPDKEIDLPDEEIDENPEIRLTEAIFVFFEKYLLFEISYQQTLSYFDVLSGTHTATVQELIASTQKLLCLERVEDVPLYSPSWIKKVEKQYSCIYFVKHRKKFIQTEKLEQKQLPLLVSSTTRETTKLLLEFPESEYETFLASRPAAKPLDNVTAWKKANFFSRLFHARQTYFNDCLAYETIFSPVNLPLFAEFKQNSWGPSETPSQGELFDNALELTVASEIVLFLDSDGTVQNTVFSDSFLKQQNYKPQVSDCIAIILQNFRRKLHRSEPANHAKSILESYIARMLNQNFYESLGPGIQENPFQNMPGLFSVNFSRYDIHPSNALISFNQTEKNSTNSTNSTSSMPTRCLITKSQNTPEEVFLQQVLDNTSANFKNSIKRTDELQHATQAIVISFHGFVFTSSPLLLSAVENRLKYLFPLADQYTVQACSDTWNRLQVDGVERFQTVGTLFEERFLGSFFNKIENPWVEPIRVKLQNQNIAVDLQLLVPYDSPGPYSRVLTLLGSAKMKRYYNEASLFTAGALFFHAQNRKTLPKAQAEQLLNDWIMPLSFELFGPPKNKSKRTSSNQHETQPYSTKKTRALTDWANYVKNWKEIVHALPL